MTVTGTEYKSTRVRGLAEWNPKPATVAVLEAVRHVLAEYRDYLPMTARQIFYRLVGTVDYPKTEQAYARLLEYLNRARRAGRIPWSAIRDDGYSQSGGGGYDNPSEFIDGIRDIADRYRRDRQYGQDVYHEIWVEAAGMLPQVARMVRAESVPVFSSGGFNSTTAKHTAAQRIYYRPVPTVVLHVGDYDPSGVAIVDSLAGDINAFLVDMGGEPATFERAAVTPEQIDRLALPGAPAKRNDRRGDFTDLATQAEALTPTQLGAEIRDALYVRYDPEQRDRVVADETDERAVLQADFAELFARYDEDNR